MKIILYITTLLTLCSANAQNFAVLTYGAAKTDEFKRGAPADWPYVWKDIGKETSLPAGFDPTWVVMTKTSLDARFKELEAEKEAWNKSQENAQQIAEEQVKAAKKIETDAAVTEVEVAFKGWQTADEKLKGEILLKLLHLILDALRSLGADVKQIEKPTAAVIETK